MEQQIKFCTTDDGVRIAYATVGHGPPLVKAVNWLSHLEFDWDSPIWRHLLAEAKWLPGKAVPFRTEGGDAATLTRVQRVIVGLHGTGRAVRSYLSSAKILKP